MKTRVVVIIDHQEDLRGITKEDIREVFYEAGDVDWTVEVVSVKEEKDS